MSKEECDYSFSTRPRKHKGGKASKEALKKLRAGNSSNRKRLNKWVARILSLEETQKKRDEVIRQLEEANQEFARSIEDLSSTIDELNEAIRQLRAKLQKHEEKKL